MAVRLDAAGGRSMRRSDTAAVRFGLALLAAVLVAAVLYVTGWGAILKNVAELAWRGNSVVNLAKRTPFTPPASGGVTETRLEAYLAICGRIKPLGDAIDAWEAEHTAQGSGPRFKGAAAGLVQEYLQEFNLALEQQRMGPAEFAWVDARMRQAAAGSLPVGEPDSDRALFAKYRDRLAASALGSHALKIAVGFAE
jgi:hypothetical protein